jgi:hypothetical protein
MTKCNGDSTHRANIKFKKWKGVKVHTISIPDSDSDEESIPPIVNTEYVRLLKTHVTTSGKVDSVIMGSLTLFEIMSAVHDDSLGPSVDTYKEPVVEETIPATTAKKRWKKGNNSICFTPSTK